MPLTETERELQLGTNGNSSIPPSDHPRFSWTEIVLQLWSHRIRIGAWTLLGTIMFIGLAFFVPKYEATAQLMPPDGNAPSGLAALAAPLLGKASDGGSIGGLLGAGDVLGSTKGSGALFAKVLQSQTIQNQLIKDFNLCEHYHLKYLEDARGKLTSRTSVTEDKKSMVLTITVKDKDPKLAVALVAAYLDQLDRVMAKVATSAARRERVFLEQRLAEEKKTLQESEQQFSKFASSHMTLDMPQQTKVTVEAAARLQGEMIDARSQLEALEQVYAPDNVRVKSLRARIAALSRDLVKINSGQVVNDVAQDPSNPYPSVKNLPLIGVQWTELYRNTKIHETVFELLTQRYEVARIQEAKDMPTVKVLDDPSVSERKYPRASYVILPGAILSFLLACIGVHWRDRWNRLDPQDPRRVLVSRIYDGVFHRGRTGRLSRQESNY
ncbi:MAG TPA: Wzz/FepE/Etk N-terminal domain-containing protein [Candidatus Angelobacter sp.]|nr:Wzz/FepE/Etk N-terminal domain-containing protein [Candidatus Angelobacter sp.]